MAGLNIDLNREISVGKKTRGKMPTKTTINLVPKKESVLATKKGVSSVILGTIIIVLLIFLLIVRPLINMMNAKTRVADLKEQLNSANEEIAQMAGLEEEYAHYTYENMTTEEMSRVDRVKVMKIVEDAIITGGVAKSWSLSDNKMTFEVRGRSLAELNQIAQALEKEDIVERCVINTANKGSRTDTTDVAVQFEIYLVKPTEGGDQ